MQFPVFWPPGASAPAPSWPLHDIVNTNIVWCMTYKREVGEGLSLYKILFRFKALVVGVNHPFIAPPICKAYRIALLLHDDCAIHAPPPTPPVYAIHHTILVMAISCKGQRGARMLPNSRAMVLHQGGQCRLSQGIKG